MVAETVTGGNLLAARNAFPADHTTLVHSNPIGNNKSKA